MSDSPKRFDDVIGMLTHDCHVYALEVARLQAELKRLRDQAVHDVGQIGDQSAEIANLKAEVERLEAVIESHKDAGLRMLAMLDEERRFTKHLKAEVERLRKAGDAMASSIQFNEEMAQDYNGPTIVHQSVQRWNAAKEGKPSA